MASITLGMMVGFEQKYVLRLITALVTNAWQSMQLLQYGIEIEIMAFTKTRQEVNRNGIRSKDFVFELAMLLIRSADEWMYNDAEQFFQGHYMGGTMIDYKYYHF